MPCQPLFQDDCWVCRISKTWRKRWKMGAFFLESPDKARIMVRRRMYTVKKRELLSFRRNKYGTIRKPISGTSGVKDFIIFLCRKLSLQKCKEATNSTVYYLWSTLVQRIRFEKYIGNCLNNVLILTPTFSMNVRIFPISIVIYICLYIFPSN